VGALLILDTSALVALVNRRERRHADCAAVLERWSGEIATTDAVVTEALYLLGPGASRGWDAQRPAVEFFLRGAFHLVPSSPASFRRTAQLMEKYQDVPMDYADATLVVLAEESLSDRVFTLDRRGFSVYKRLGRDPFVLLPD
jgi:hypothetical protein